MGWEGVLVCIRLPLTGAQVPIPSYTCTEPDEFGFNDQGRCTVSGGLRTCEIMEGPDSNIGGLYIWNGNTNPFVVLDIPQGWRVGSVKMTFRARGSIPTLSLSVHSTERLSTNTDRTMFSLVSEASTTPVMMNLTTLARGKYLRINMTSTGRLYLNEIEVFGTSRYTFTDTRKLHDLLIPLLTSFNCPLSQMKASVHIHPQLVETLLAQPLQSQLSVSTQIMCIVSTAVSTHLYSDTCMYISLCIFSDFWWWCIQLCMLPPSHHHLASLHVAGVGNGGLCIEVFGTSRFTVTGPA